MSRRRLVVVAAVVVAALAVFVVVWFEPQALWIDDEVDEPVPSSPEVIALGGEDVVADPTGPEELAAGDLRGVEGHDVRAGRAVVLRLIDGSRFVRLDGLDAQNGPDLHVYLSAAPADGDPDAHDDDYVSLGGLKGNQGSSNYAIPDDLELDRFASAVIWCERFSVAFAVAPLS